MPKGRIWPSEAKVVQDPASGIEIRQLTDYLGHSHHLYFTNPGWYAGGRRLLFGSDRENRTDLFALDLESGEITQLTDLPLVPPPHETSFLSTCINPTRDEAYFWYERRILALDLATLELRPLWEAPEGFRRSMLNCTADGRFVCAGVFEDLSNRFRIDYLRGYVGFRETWASNPLSRIVQAAVDGSGAEVAWEERYWIGHVNTSPTQPHLLTFCHEGPWDKVDNRMWCLDLRTRKAWPLREREGQEAVGHEYWLADGLHIAYHGRWPDGRKCFGRIRFDNTDRTEVSFPHETGHMHSNDFDLLVGDGSPYVRLWRWNGSGFDGPRILAEHRSSMHIQKTHVHPRFSPDGSHVVYTSDRSGYGNVYLAPVPPFGSLPEVPAGK
ncbi:MAG TPA: oligogalacturonate lyase family protein [Planctomycetota bacterium]|nr:oligogalacturonate lyase family protein [Planctomycetota bacterium]